MAHLSRTAVAGLMLTSALAYSQQSPNPQPTQPQSVPCVTTSTSPNPSGNNTAIKVPGKWRQALNKQLQKVGDKTGLPMPDVPTDIEQPANTKPAPCIPQAASTRNAPPAQTPVLKLPPDTTVQLRCNPMAPSPKDANGRPGTLVLPDPHDYGFPKPTDFEVDSVIPDLAAKTPCWRVKVDPTTAKYFVVQ